MAGENSDIEGGDFDGWQNRLRVLLDARGLDYCEVSKGSGNNAQYLSKVLTKQLVNPTINRILAICSYADIDPALVFSTEPLESIVLEKAARLKEHEAQIVARILESSKPG